jgi:hypothetical protein
MKIVVGINRIFITDANHTSVYSYQLAKHTALVKTTENNRSRVVGLSSYRVQNSRGDNKQAMIRK